MAEWSPIPQQIEGAVERTEMLRKSHEPIWVKVRKHLADQDLSVEDAVLAGWHTGGHRASEGTIAMRDGRVFHFTIIHDADRDPSEGDGRIAGWTLAPAEQSRVIVGGYPSAEYEAATYARVLLEGE